MINDILSIDNELLVLAAILPVFLLWHSRFRAVSLVLLADFLLLFSISELSFETNKLDSFLINPLFSHTESVFLLKGAAYTALCMIYLALRQRFIPFYLGIMSGAAAIAHMAYPPLSLGWFYTHYETIMGAYCVIQLLIIYIGGHRELFNQLCHWGSAWGSRIGFDPHRHKGT